MVGQGSEAMQVIYMEVEGIRFAYQLSRDAAKLLRNIAKFLLCSLKDTPYKKTRGKTNLKNFLTRANGQSVIPVTMEKGVYEKFKKDAGKYGILFHAFSPLRSGKKGAVEVVIAEKDMAMAQEILSRIKERKIREDVKNGMSGEQAGQKFDENNHTETMDEFAENVGATAPEDVFEEDMKERFGEDYEEKIINFTKQTEERGKKNAPKGRTAGANPKKVENLADIISFRERAETLNRKDAVKLQFIYDVGRGESQIVEETETHVRIAGKNLTGREKSGWESIWIPKKVISPPLGKSPDGNYTAYMPEDSDILVEDMAGKRKPETIKAGEIGKGQMPADGRRVKIPDKATNPAPVPLVKNMVRRGRG